MFSRVGQRGTGLSATIARSEHEISEIIDGLSEQEVVMNLQSSLSCLSFVQSTVAHVEHYLFYTPFTPILLGLLLFLKLWPD